MKSRYYILSITYLSVVLLKLILGPLVCTPTILGDEVIYMWIAKEPLHNQIIIGNQYPILYPFVLSVFPSDSIQTTYIIAKALNIFISSFIIFPVFYLSRFFHNDHVSLIIGICSLFIPVGFVYSFLVMSENLFFPLFLTSVYLVFKSEIDNKRWLYVISGIVMALTILTRIIGLILIVSYLLYLLYKYILYKTYNKNCGILLFFLSLILLPYFIFYKGLLYGFHEKGIVGYTVLSPIRGGHCTIYDFLSMFVSYFDYFILSTGVILGILSLVILYKILINKEKSTFANFTVFSCICVFFTIIVCSIFLAGEYRIISRYIAFLIPLFLIIGFKAIGRWSNNKNRSFLIISFIVLISSFFIIIGHGSETEILKGYFSSLKNILIIELSIVLSFVLILFFPKPNRRKKRKIVRYIAIGLIWFLFISGVTNDFRDVVLSSEKSFDKEIIGKYISDYDGRIIFDEDIYNEFKNYFWRLQFWSDGEVFVGSVNTEGEFFVTSKNLSYPLLVHQQMSYNKENITLYLYQKV